MRTSYYAFGLSLLLPLGLEAQGPGGRGTPIPAGAQCPPGQTEIRPRTCMAPEIPAPSILDYRPRSTLVVPANMVKKAKYPTIDFHGHPQGRIGKAVGPCRPPYNELPRQKSQHARQKEQPACQAARGLAAANRQFNRSFE